MAGSRTVRKGTTRLVGFAALIAAGFSLVLALSFLDVGGFCGPGCLDRRLAATVRPDGTLDTAKIDTARGLIAAQLRLSPFDDSAWLRLAALEVEAAGRMTPTAVRALESSYRYAPVDAEVARWRLAFAFQHWRDLPPTTRRAVELEMRSLARAEGNLRMLAEVEPGITDPGGRLAFHLTRLGLEQAWR